MELVPIVNEHSNEPTGACLSRAEALATGSWCRSTNVFVLNAKGEVLCHQRSLQKERLPGAWMTHVGGHVAVGETYDGNARKELAEETGITGDPPLIAWRTTRIANAKFWVREYVTVCDLPVERFVPQPGEVERFAWLAPEDIARRAAAADGTWCAGTHDFLTDYACMRAAITAASTTGAALAAEHMHVWHPVAA